MVGREHDDGRSVLEPPELLALADLARRTEPRDDLAAGAWTLNYNYGPGFAREFLNSYGAPPMTDAEIERLRRRYGR